MNPLILKCIGAAGLLFITTGILTQKRKAQDLLYIIGGILLEVYSIIIGDIIFIILQIIFTIAAVYDLIRTNKK
jgi:hypothetical protein